jgi:hypothetical protein
MGLAHAADGVEEEYAGALPHLFDRNATLDECAPSALRVPIRGGFMRSHLLDIDVYAGVPVKRLYESEICAGLSVVCRHHPCRDSVGQGDTCSPLYRYVLGKANPGDFSIGVTQPNRGMDRVRAGIWDRWADLFFPRAMAALLGIRSRAFSQKM